MQLPIESPLDRRKDQRLRGKDRRIKPRCRCPLPAVIATSSWKEISDCLDISMSGCRIRIRQFLEIKTEVSIQFYLMDSSLNRFNSCQPIQAKVVSSFAPNSEGFMQIGFCFSETPREAHGISTIIEKYL